MKLFFKACLLGLGAFLVIRWFLLVTRAKKPMGQAAKEAASIPVQAIGTAAAVAVDRSKWSAAKDIVVQGFKQRRSILDIYAELIALVERKPSPDKQGNEVARGETVPRDERPPVVPNSSGLGAGVGRGAR